MATLLPILLEPYLLPRLHTTRGVVSNYARYHATRMCSVVWGSQLGSRHVPAEQIPTETVER
eukprot:5162171-Prymnesium_polylepis.1